MRFYRNMNISFRVLLSKSCKTISETVQQHGTDCSLLLFYCTKVKLGTPVTKKTVA